MDSNPRRIFNIRMDGMCSYPSPGLSRAFGESIYDRAPMSLPDSGLDAVTAPSVGDSSTNHADQSSCSHGQLLLPTTRDVRSPDHIVPTTSSILSQPSRTSSFDTNHSTTGLSIRLLKPRLNQGGVVVLPRIETHVHLDIVFSSQSWNAIQLPRTKSVTSDDSSSVGKEIKPLLLLITVRGATTQQPCDRVCEQCERRMGQNVGPPSLLDFHSSSNIIRANDGRVRAHFTFCCYSRHHQKEDEQYALEVILKDISNPSQPIEVARKELPYSFDVRPQPRQANIGASSKSRRRTQKNTPSVQRPHPGGIKRQTRAGQRTSGHVSSIDDPKQQSPSSFGFNAQHTSFASDASAQHISDGGIRKGQSYNTPKILGQWIPPPSALVRLLPSEREVQIRALEMKIMDLKATFETESQGKFAAIMDHFNSRILAVQKDVADHFNRAPGSGSGYLESRGSGHVS